MPAGEDDAGKPSSATPSLGRRAAPAPSQLEGLGPWSLPLSWVGEGSKNVRRRGVGLQRSPRGQSSATVCLPFIPPLPSSRSALSVLLTKAASSEQLRLQSSQNNKG